MTLNYGLVRLEHRIAEGRYKQFCTWRKVDPALTLNIKLRLLDGDAHGIPLR